MRTYGDLYYAGPAPSATEAPLTDGAEGVWTVHSDTHADVQYTVIRTPDGRFVCDCRGCRYQARADGECKHIDRVRGWLAAGAGSILAAATLRGERHD